MMSARPIADRELLAGEGARFSTGLLPEDDEASLPESVVPPQPLQVRVHVGGRLVAQVTIFFEHLVEDVFKLRGQVRVQAHRRNERPVHDRVGNHSGCFAAKTAGRQ